MTDSAEKNEMTNVATIQNVEQLTPLLILSKASLSLKKDDVGDGGDTTATSSPTQVTILQQSAEATKDGHTSPTHTAELMLAGGLPKNRKRPGLASENQRVTMTGTITRGDSVGHPVEVQLELTETEFLRLTSREPPPKGDNKFDCGPNQGPHIILWSFLCIPVAMVISICISFYNGSMTWYNLIIYYSEERTFIHKIALSPLIILSFPVTVGLSSFFISLVASVMQISWSWQRWLAEIRDGEKGFYGWVCDKVGLPNCSPYQVVVLGSSDTYIL